MAKGLFLVRGAVRKLGGRFAPRPDQGLPGVDEGVDPGYGVEGPETDPEEEGEAGQLPILPADPTTPPGTIWPPLPPDFGQLPSPIPKKIWVAAGIPGVGRRFVVVDLSQRPQPK